MEEQFSQRLKRLRKKKGLSRAALSELCGLNPDAIRRYENGSRKPGMDAIINIADVLKVSTDYLLCIKNF